MLGLEDEEEEPRVDVCLNNYYYNIYRIVRSKGKKGTGWRYRSIVF
jgi:hypothetical protein